MSFVIGVGQVYALDANDIRATIKDERMDIKATVKEDIKATITNRPTGIVKIINSHAVLSNARITGKTSDGFTIGTLEGTSVTVFVTGNTVLRRKYWGKSTLDEMQVGDTVLVAGKWKNEEKTEMTASFVRDFSIQKRHGTFFGTVSSVSTTGILLKTEKRGDQNVTITTSAKLVNRNMGTVKQTDIIVGQRVRVKGLWNNQMNTITEVTQVKDFSLPVKPSPKPSPTPKS